MFLICKKKDVQLERYDYNEPQKGKDQCDRESAVAKRYINAYVNAGNNCMSAAEIKKGVLFLGGSNDSKVSVVEIDKTKTAMSVTKIPNISTIHSISYSNDGMTMWQYFDCGKGKDIKFFELEFVSGLTIVEPFEGSENTSASVGKQRQRKDRCLNTGVFCNEPTCLMFFENEADLENHKSENTHQTHNTPTTMDSILLHHADLLIQSSSSKSIGRIEARRVDMDDRRGSFSLDKKVDEAGWGIPVRKFVRFTPKQKRFLYEEFMNGERTGSKTTPEKVLIKMRTTRDNNNSKLFNSKEYLSRQQVISSFSRMSKQFRQGVLKQPEAEEIDMEIEPSEEIEDIFIDEQENLIQEVIDQVKIQVHQ